MMMEFPYGKLMIGPPGADDLPEKLPVVELLPFTRPEWRQTKSLPDYYDRAPTAFSNTSSESSRRSLFSTSGYPDPDKVAMTPRTDDCPKAFTDRSNGSRQPKQKDARPTEGQKNSYASPLGREKSTLDDIKSGSSPSIKHSCVRRSISDSDMIKQQDMRVQGKRINKASSSKVSLMYSSHWQYYKVPKCYSVPPGAMPSRLEAAQTIEDLCARIEHLQDAYVDEGIYDAFDRSYTLPSITVNNAPMRRKQIQTDGRPRKPSAKVGARPTFQLGVANSLDVLSQYGRPVRVERQLTMHLKQTINTLRRTKDVTSVSGPYVCGRSVTKPEFSVSARSLDLGMLKFDRDPNLFNPRQEIISRNDTWPDGALSRCTTRMRSEQMYDSGIESNNGDIGSSAPRLRSKKSGRLNDGCDSPQMFQRSNTLPLIASVGGNQQGMRPPGSERPEAASESSVSKQDSMRDGVMGHSEKMPKITEDITSTQRSHINGPHTSPVSDRRTNVTRGPSVASDPDRMDTKDIENNLNLESDSRMLHVVNIKEEEGHTGSGTVAEAECAVPDPGKGATVPEANTEKSHDIVTIPQSGPALSEDATTEATQDDNPSGIGIGDDQSVGSALPNDSSITPKPTEAGAYDAAQQGSGAADDGNITSQGNQSSQSGTVTATTPTDTVTPPSDNKLPSENTQNSACTNTSEESIEGNETTPLKELEGSNVNDIEKPAVLEPADTDLVNNNSNNRRGSLVSSSQDTDNSGYSKEWVEAKNGNNLDENENIRAV